MVSSWNPPFRRDSTWAKGGRVDSACDTGVSGREILMLSLRGAASVRLWRDLPILLTSVGPRGSPNGHNCCPFLWFGENCCVWDTENGHRPPSTSTGSQAISVLHAWPTDVETLCLKVCHWHSREILTAWPAQGWKEDRTVGSWRKFTAHSGGSLIWKSRT